MASQQIIFVLHDSHLRVVSEEEAIATLTAEELTQPRRFERIDTKQFQADIDGGHWGASHRYIRQRAAEIRAVGDEKGATLLRYMGIPEVPHAIAVGAYLGDERLVDVRDFDRDRSRWEWPDPSHLLELESHALPRDTIVQPGNAVLRVEISALILDADVDAAIGKERLCDIRIRPKSLTPVPGLVQSADDVQQIRLLVREALAAIVATRPNTDLIYLFVAAPVSVCLVIGQELRLRNGKEVQTYRYRANRSDRTLHPAILLTSSEANERAKPLSAADVERARELRFIWQAALSDIRTHAQVLRTRQTPANSAWYASLEPSKLLADVRPLPGLRPMWELIQDEDSVSLDAYAGEFELNSESREWRLSDDLVLAMFEAAERDTSRMQMFARLFFWHEYVHEWQGVTSSTSVQIGRLANCLERIDYMADAYAIFHQVDFLVREAGLPAIDERRYQDHIVNQVGVALRSFWAFEDSPPTTVVQERRLRRYLNWYWRRVQLRRSPSLCAALTLLARQPCIEISGLRRQVTSDRVFIVIQEPGGFAGLHIGVVLEDGRILRKGSSVDASIEELLRAFSQHDQSAIERFFDATFDHIKQTGGAFPAG